MGSCCDFNAPKIYKLKVKGKTIGLLGVEQTFLDVKEPNLTDKYWLDISLI
ncbi:MAG: hypothetical protein XE00_0093 [Desulfofundulus kuznetsovii]|nr:MAG: hypothetical protein XD84_1400 [Desulfotomaculum sp. 46_80]KUK85381.1 MAG: hypothetical protein XE00_0093 [Desulfofundulus kuznetsovii]